MTDRFEREMRDGLNGALVQGRFVREFGRPEPLSASVRDERMETALDSELAEHQRYVAANDALPPALADAARAGQLLAQDLTGTRRTNVSRVRDGLQIALDGLGHEPCAKLLTDILLGAHYLCDPHEYRQDSMAQWAERLSDAADDLRGYIGPAGARDNSDAAYEMARDRRDGE